MNPAAFLARAARQRFAWGRFDCCLWLADWMIEARGIDPAANLRGAYASPLAGARILKSCGGVLGVVGEGARACGLAPTERPDRGAVGVVLGPTRRGLEHIGAICAQPGRWAVLAAAGLIVAPFDTVRAWEV